MQTDMSLSKNRAAMGWNVSLNIKQNETNELHLHMIKILLILFAIFIKWWGFSAIFPFQTATRSVCFSSWQKCYQMKTITKWKEIEIKSEDRSKKEEERMEKKTICFEMKIKLRVEYYAWCMHRYISILFYQIRHTKQYMLLQYEH